MPKLATIAEQVTDEFNERFRKLPPDKQLEIVAWLKGRGMDGSDGAGIQILMTRWISSQHSIPAAILEYAMILERVDRAME